ncbi:MAG: hypothetical protein ACTH3E_08775 [Psychroflexus halocasei]|uniref:hypothetical protein n=1 Tax=Psychroflexus sp. S27 TaxID=1982757 RepID=UPI000C299BB7|nr:hypothetical protein [Psychroflexus sp. S27]PJX27589.1 hypothetical protein CAP47_01785 [Psychroflexus sp. S27]
MKRKKAKLFSSFLASLLLAVILLPSVHSFHHEDAFKPSHCDVEHTHVNQLETHCGICDLQLQPITPIQLFSFELIIPDFIKTDVLSVKKIYFSKSDSFFRLRAPPVA